MPCLQGDTSCIMFIFGVMRYTMLEYKKLMVFIIGHPQKRHKLSTRRERSLDALGRLLYVLKYYPVDYLDYPPE